MPSSEILSAPWNLCLGRLFSFFLLIFLPSRSAVGQAQRPPWPQFSIIQLRLAPIHAAARPASMGGAFIGVADDATAAAINPAGLSFLLRPEISLSQAGGWHTREFAVAPAAAFDETQSDTEFIFDQTLVNIVYPQWGFTFAFFRQVASRSESDFSRQQFLKISPGRRLSLNEQLGASGNFPGIQGEYTAEVIHNAFVIAKALHRRYRIGLTLRNTQFKLQLHEKHYFDPAAWLQSDFTGTAAVRPNRIEGLYRLYELSAKELKPSWSLGLLAELHPHVTLGIAYQNLPAYDLESHIILPAYSLPDSTPNDARNDEIRFAPQEEIIPFTLDLPDHLGLGLGWKVNKTLLSADVVLYFTRTLFQGLNMDLPQDNIPLNNVKYTDPDGRNDLETRNVLSFHAGLEHTFVERKIVLPIRMGFYTEPSFALRPVSSDKNLQQEYPEAATYPHVTGGFGIIFKQVRFEGSVDFSSTLVEAIGSAVVSF